MAQWKSGSYTTDVNPVIGPRDLLRMTRPYSWQKCCTMLDTFRMPCSWWTMDEDPY